MKLKQAIDEEMHTLYKNQTWDIEELPTVKKAITYTRIYKPKYIKEGLVERNKVRLISGGYDLYTRTKGVFNWDCFILSNNQ